MSFCEKAISGQLPPEWMLDVPPLEEHRYLNLKRNLFAQATQFDAERKHVIAANVELLAHVCGMSLKSNDPDTPFVPCASWNDGSRTASLGDLTAEHLKVLEEIAGRSTDSAVVARVSDVLFLKSRPFSKLYAERAIAHYLKLAESVRLTQIARISLAANYLERSIYLWRRTGSESLIVRGEIEAELMACLMLEKPEPSNFSREILFRLAKILADREDASKWVAIGKRLMHESRAGGGFEKARAYADTTIELLRIEKSGAAEIDSIRNQKTELFVDEARSLRAAGCAPMIVQRAYNKAIDACRNTRGQSVVARELLAELVELQKDIPAGLAEISIPVDLTENIESALAAVRSGDLKTLLRVIYLKTVPEKKQELFARAQETVTEFPLMTTIGTELIDEKGKVIERVPGAPRTEDERKAVLRYQASQSVVRRIWLTGHVLGAIRQEINNRVDFDEAAIAALLDPNPFVPNARRAQFLRGLLAGFRGDLISSTAILVPQIENSLRHVMQQAGHNMVSMDTEGLQREKDLNAFIYGTEFQNLFGEDLQFQLQVLLCDHTGLNLRNRVAHGLMPDGMALSGVAVFLWAMALGLCLHFQENAASFASDDSTAE